MKLRFLVVFYLIYLSWTLWDLSQARKSLEISIFDVGQGDSIFIRTPNGKNILIDGGPSAEVDKYVFRKLPYKCHIDLLFLTHPHKDHVAGLNRILQRCTTGIVYFNPVPYGTREYQLFKQLLLNREHKLISAGQMINVDGINLYVLWPEKAYANNFNDKNVNLISTVLFINYKNVEALFTGDAELEILTQINWGEVNGLIEDGLDVLKVPHQGARDSHYPRLYQIMQPKHAVISVGKNSYGHPHDEVIRFINESQITLHRTDEGTVTFKY